MSTSDHISLLKVPCPLTHWPAQGGVYIGIKASPRGEIHHLIAALGKHVLDAQEWGPSKIKGANSDFDGLANTIAMARYGSALAKRVRSLNIEGHKDWYVPSKAEGNLLAANAAHLLGSSEYWLSTKSQGAFAWAHDMDQGVQHQAHTAQAFRVIPVRSIRIA